VIQFYPATIWPIFPLICQYHHSTNALIETSTNPTLINPFASTLIEKLWQFHVINSANQLLSPQNCIFHCPPLTLDGNPKKPKLKLFCKWISTWHGTLIYVIWWKSWYCEIFVVVTKKISSSLLTELLEKIHKIFCVWP